MNDRVKYILILIYFLTFVEAINEYYNTLTVNFDEVRIYSIIPDK